MPESPRTHRLLLLGHRGARVLKSIPENTLASFDRALADGCDGFEFDVRLTADNAAVVCHDPKTGDIEIANATVAQLPNLPRLEDVLARYQDNAFLDMELKVKGLEEVTSALLRRNPPRRGFVVSSFLPEALQALHQLDPIIPLGLICETGTQLRVWTHLPLQYVIPHHKLATPDLLSELKGAGIKVLVWTVNASADMKRFAKAGVEGIISDDTGLLAQTLGN
jgi:glycerophosphoryl diester phosphodiesterase